MEIAPFEGFSKELTDFYRDLSQNNDKQWFEEHRADYKKHVIEPAQAFVMAMAPLLKELFPGIVADPRLNGSGSIFRIYRDVRFSKDKSPYKTHLGIYFWQGPRKKIENPGCYFQVEPPNIMMGCGIYCFSRELLAKYRDAVVDDKLGPALISAIEKVKAEGKYVIGGRHYKRVPRGFDKAHKNARYLLHNGLYVSWETPIVAKFYSAELLDYCMGHWRAMHPINQWLEKVLG